MRRVGRLFQFIGGSVGRVAGTAMVTGLFLFLAGMTPAQWVASVLDNPPHWLNDPWFKIGLILSGLLAIWASVSFNRWSKRQIAIDNLAEDLSWAIHNLLNRSPRPSAENEINTWRHDYDIWCQKVAEKLGDRAFFTRADQLHFDRLGFIENVTLSGESYLDWLLSQLRTKFDRLRDVINWSQQRKWGVMPRSAGPLQPLLLKVDR